MTLAEKLLPKLSEWRPAGTGRHSWSARPDGADWTVRLTAKQVDSLSALLWDVEVERDGAAPADLKAWANRVAARATGLMEPLRVLEIDAPRGEALLRSTAPAQRDGAVLYYEVRLTAAGRASLRRFQGSRTASEREAIPFALTHEAIAKLADDLCAE